MFTTYWFELHEVNKPQNMLIKIDEWVIQAESDQEAWKDASSMFNYRQKGLTDLQRIVLKEKRKGFWMNAEKFCDNYREERKRYTW